MVQQLKNPRVIHVAHALGAGIDVHNQYVTACVAANLGTSMDKVVVQEFRRTPDGMDCLCRFLGKYLIGSIVMEATGVYFPTVLDALEAHQGWGGIKPRIIVINPSLLKKYAGELHEDKADAFELAKLGLAGLARSSFIPTDKLRELRGLCREIRFVDRDCTRIKNRIKRILALWGLPLKNFDLSRAWALDILRALLQAKGDFGAALESVETGTFATTKTTKTTVLRRKEMYDPFRTIKVPDSALASMESYALELSFNAAIMSKLKDKIEVLVNQDALLARAVKRIRVIPGLSDTSAAAIIAEIGNIDRFPNRKLFLKYVGCAPAQHQSGETAIAGHLAAHSNRVARYYFCTAGRIVAETIAEDSDLKEYARKQINAHFKDKKLAYANTGIKIARLVFALLTKGVEYTPFRERDAPSSGVQTSTTKSKTDQVILKTIRYKTKNLVRFLEKAVGNRSEPWYDYLAGLFEKLGASKKKAKVDDPTPANDEGGGKNNI